MSGTLLNISVFLVGALLSALALLLTHRRFLAGSTADLQTARKALSARASEVDTALRSVASVVEAAPTIDQIDEMLLAKAKHQEITAKETDRLKNLEEQLASVQEEVAQRDQKQRELHETRENVQRMADELYTNNEKLVTETKQLEGELKQSKEMLEALSSQHNLGTEHTASIDGVVASQESTISQLMAIQELHQQATERYGNLEKQYTDLETEYKKLQATLLERQAAG